MTVGFEIGTAESAGELRANTARSSATEAGSVRETAPRSPSEELSPLMRVDALRIALIAAIVILHAKPVVEPDAPHTLLNFIGRFLQVGPFMTVVPVLSCVSGYLLFRSRLDQTPVALVRKKSRTLLLPLLMWNLPLALITWWAQQHGKFLEQRLVLGGPGANLVDWLDALFGLTSNPIDFPLHFMRDLYVLCLLSIGIGPLLRRSPIATFMGVYVVFVLFNWDGDVVRRVEMASMFVGGGVLAVTNANIRAFDRYWRPLIAIFLFTSLAVVIDGDKTKLGFLRILGVVSLWPTFGALMKTRVGRWLNAQSHYSFWLFATHGPLLELMHKFWRPAALGVRDEAYWLVGPVCAIAISVAAFHAVSAIAPTYVALATGGRIRSKRRDPSAAAQTA